MYPNYYIKAGTLPSATEYVLCQPSEADNADFQIFLQKNNYELIQEEAFVQVYRTKK
jgi:hypothetical protein